MTTPHDPGTRLTQLHGPMIHQLAALRMRELADHPDVDLIAHLATMTCAGHPRVRGGACVGAAEVITAHGDDLMYGGPHRSATRRALVDGLAISALLTDGGVWNEAFGHLCAHPHADCPNPGERPIVPRHAPA